MKHLLLLAVLSIYFTNVFGIDVRIVSESGPVFGARVTGYTERMDSTETCVSDTTGLVVLRSARTSVINIDHSDYSQKIVKLSEITDGIVKLSPAPKLAELEVTASNRTQFLNHASYRLSMQQMKDYSSFYNALNEIPEIIVMPSGTLYYNGETNVAMLLNGVETTRQELSTIAKDDILKIDVYDTPPARFAVNGYRGVIDVITKSGIRGGNVGIDLSQAVKPVWGNNSAALYYNYRRSRFSLRVNNENRHFRHIRENSTLRYEFDGVEYEKRKTGNDSKEDIDDNSVIISYQNNNPESYLYNIEVGGKLNRFYRNISQNVFSNDHDFSAYTRLNTRYDNYWIRNYFEKKLGDKGSSGTLLANIRYTHFNNDYHSAYLEYETDEPDKPFENHHDDYNTRYDALFGEMQYILPQKRWGQMYAVVYGTYKKSTYLDTESDFFQKNGVAGTELQYYGFLGKFYTQGSAGIKYEYSKTQSVDKPYSRVNPSARIRTYRYLRHNLYVMLGYNFSTSLPMIAQLSETNQWRDNHLIYHGNSTLKPYHTHEIEAMTNMWSKYFDGSLSLSYSINPGMICSHFIRTDDHILETIVNLDRYNEFFSRLTATVKPLGSKVWTLSAFIRFGTVNGRGPEYEWTSHRFQLNASTSLMLGRWTVQLEYQHPGKVSEGQLVRPRGQHWQANAMFRASDNLFVGLSVRKPFGKDFRESERTVHTSIVHSETENIIKDWKNVVSLTLNWNISFGKKRNNYNPQFDNLDTDTGIMNKYNEK